VQVGAEAVEEEANAHFSMVIRQWADEMPTDVEDGRFRDGLDMDERRVRLHESASDGALAPDEDTRAEHAPLELHQANPQTIRFDPDSAQVVGADRTSLERFGRVLDDPVHPPFPLQLEGFASTEGPTDHNDELAQQRADAVADLLRPLTPDTPITASGMGEGEGSTPEWRKVEIWFGTYDAVQATVVHEFGHMLGLEDEYVESDTGREAGDNVTQPGGGSTRARDSESVMSNGEEVQPQHYGTMLEALRAMTGIQGWDVRPVVEPTQ
jgi:outer membrane protein OmpA-like peptidoglycan-associated protein